jgi:uncharacterized protein YigE (DUF2233 family)
MNLEKQQLLIEYALSNPDLFAKINHILKPTFVGTILDVHRRLTVGEISDGNAKFAVVALGETGKIAT